MPGAKVQSLLSKVKNVKKVAIDLSKGEAVIDMEKPIPTSELQNALKDYAKYQLSENGHYQHQITAVAEEETKSWMETYKPILLIFA